MDRISRIRSIIRWQDLFKEKREIVQTYESKEKELNQLKESLEISVANKIKLTDQNDALTSKVLQEESQMDHIIDAINALENDKDNLKVTRQIRSWEKDMERYSQEREILEAQLCYDKSKIDDITQELANIETNFLIQSSEIKKLDTEITNIKHSKKGDCDRIDGAMCEISAQFDANFVGYFIRLLSKNSGSVTAMIEQDSCSGCHILLPTSFHGGDTLQDAEDSALLQCPNCFRYLYYGDDL